MQWKPRLMTLSSLPLKPLTAHPRRRLRLRIRAFRYGLDGLVVANLAVMGASVSTNPFNVVWQLLWIFYGLTAAAAVGLVSAILVVLPVLDARSAAKVGASNLGVGSAAVAGLISADASACPHQMPLNACPESSRKP